MQPATNTVVENTQRGKGPALHIQTESEVKRNSDIDSVISPLSVKMSTIVKVRERIDFVLKGCKCKTGCTSNRCKSKKKLHMCGPGCQCLNCCNMQTHQQQDVNEDVHYMEVEEHGHDGDSDQYVDESEDDLEMWGDEEVVDILQSVFGIDSDTEEL